MNRDNLGTVAICLIAAACASRPIDARQLNPAPRDVSSPEEISAEIAGLPVLWQSRDSAGAIGDLVFLDGTSGPIARLPEGAIGASMSPSGRYFAYATNLLPGGDIEILDSTTGETRILIDGSERFPGASLSFPSFADDETSVVFEVVGNDRIDLGVVELSTGKVQFLALGGVFNQWPTASPDGKFYLVVCEREGRTGFSLCLLDREALTRYHLVEDQVSQKGVFTPAGAQVVYVGISGGIFGEGSLKVVQVDGEDNRTLMTGLHTGAATLGATSEDAVFTCRVPERPACSSVCVIGLDGSDPRRLDYLGERCVVPSSDASP